MALYGQLSTMSLMDLLQWAGINRKSGVFELERNRISKKLMFRNGRVVACYCDDPQSRLGQFLMARGMITSENLREALGRQQGSGESVGDILQQMGLVTQAQLTDLLSQKAEEMILSLFDWNHAIFRFEEMGSLGPYVIDVDLSVDDVLLKGLQRVDELAVIRQTFHSSGIVLKTTGKKMPREVEVSSMAQRIVGAVDGERTLVEILLHTNSTEFLVLKLLYNLYNRGLFAIHEVREIGEESLTIVDPWRSHGSASTPRQAESADYAARLALARSVEDSLPEVDAAFTGKAFVPSNTPHKAVGAEVSAETPVDPNQVQYEPEERSEDLAFSFEEGAAAASEGAPAKEATASGPQAEKAIDEAAAAVRKLAVEMEETLTIVPWRDNHSAKEKQVAPQRTATPLPEVPSSELEQGLRTAQAAFEQRDYGKTLDVLDVCYRRNAESNLVKEWIQKAEQAYVDHAEEIGLGEEAVPKRIPNEGVPAKLPPQASYLLSLIDDETEIRALSWLAPMRGVDVLRNLDRLRAKGAIEIHEMKPAP